MKVERAIITVAVLIVVVFGLLCFVIGMVTDRMLVNKKLDELIRTMKCP